MRDGDAGAIAGRGCRRDVGLCVEEGITHGMTAGRLTDVGFGEKEEIDGSLPKLSLERLLSFKFKLSLERAMLEIMGNAFVATVEEITKVELATEGIIFTAPIAGCCVFPNGSRDTSSFKYCRQPSFNMSPPSTSGGFTRNGCSTDFRVGNTK